MTMDRAALASALQRMPFSQLSEMADLARERPGSIRLDVGQPNFKTPDHICEAAKRAIDEGWTFYTPLAGLPSLRERLAAKLDRVNGIAVDAGQVVCGTGGCGVIAAALMSLTNAGDEVLLPDPYWHAYRFMLGVTQTGGVTYPCRPENGFLPDPDEMERLCSQRARVLLLNTPHNPSGAVYPPNVLAGLARVAERHGLWVVSDECYDQTVFDGAQSAPSMWHHAEPDRVVCCFTFSKSYAMTGWRLGYAAAPHAVAGAMTKALEATTSSNSAVSQKAGEAALDGPQDSVEAMVSAYQRRRDLVVDLLRESGLLLTVPSGAFYILADVSRSGLDSRAFAHRLLREQAVAVVPGTAFGQVARGAVRISLASSDDDLREGVGRLCDLVAELA